MAVRHTRLWLGVIVGVLIFLFSPAESSLLARNSRLSVVPLTEEQYSIITGK